MRNVILVVIFLFCSQFLISSVDAQGAPAVNVSCTIDNGTDYWADNNETGNSDNGTDDVNGTSDWNGDNATGNDNVIYLDYLLINSTSEIYCVVSNPNAYIEVVSITASNENFLLGSEHTNMTIESNGFAYFNTSITVETPLLVIASHMLIVTVVVTEANGVTTTSLYESTVNILVSHSAGTTDAGSCSSFGEPTWPTNLQMVIEQDASNATSNNSNNSPMEHVLAIELNATAAPLHVKNFLLLSQLGCYDNVLLHRTIDNFIIQGGDFENGDGTGGFAAFFAGYCDGNTNSSSSDCSFEDWTLPLEVNNGLTHGPCSISMARASDLNGAGSQFFIVPGDSPQPQLDGSYSIFGSVTSGCDSVTYLSEVTTGGWDRPIDDIRIKSILPDSDADGDGIGDNSDAFPNDADETNDSDGDGYGDNQDVFDNDSSEWNDADGDGIGDNADECDNTTVNGQGTLGDNGCWEILDSDFDSVEDDLDICPNTLANSQVDASGCASNQRDNDSDGVVDSFDQCPSTPLNTVIDQTGCEVTAAGDANSTDSSGSDTDDDAMPGFEPILLFVSLFFAITTIRRRKY
jgi:cyclophilin family peptidyl-prolyl cis-trans isomerase